MTAPNRSAPPANWEELREIALALESATDTASGAFVAIPSKALRALGTRLRNIAAGSSPAKELLRPRAKGERPPWTHFHVMRSIAVWRARAERSTETAALDAGRALFPDLEAPTRERMKRLASQYREVALDYLESEGVTFYWDASSRRRRERGSRRDLSRVRQVSVNRAHRGKSI